MTERLLAECTYPDCGRTPRFGLHAAVVSAVSTLSAVEHRPFDTCCGQHLAMKLTRYHATQQFVAVTRLKAG